MLRKTCLAASLMVALASSAASASMSLPTRSVANETGGTAVAENTALLNINKASAQELAAIMIGVGLKRAEQIIQLRDQLGGFTELEQLLDVKGIGLKTLEKNQALIRLD